MTSRILRPARATRRTTGPRSAAPLAVRLPLVAAAVVAAGLTAACGPSTQPTGAAAPATAAQPSQSLGAETQSASAEASPTASAASSAPPSASASAGTPAGASPTPSRAQSAKPAPKPSRTSAAPAPAARIPGPGYDSSADAQKLIDAALRAAKADGRMVLLDFGANWCGNCKAADKVFAQPQTASILGASYHLVKVDIGGNSSANSALLRKYSPSGGTYKMPVLVVVSPSGTVRTDTHVTGNPALTSDGLGSFLRKWAS
ncbi:MULTISPECIES: thioredoxin family protein [unclassified Streptomyces]|uniref:thioredoxin family protein n=1 Tax=unclassified Streptomyces TaxID=2593676 RepID=UPI00202E06ED|nr:MULTISPECIES: thioredoxin family protein [unclassified Streptomyces]MCM1966468.1 thioredoxin family protein [Streptomyces sp. G1]MCX5129689.1 thioredoxin family protein [Streptomyces sp. NBC_00347]